ncbi:hypothetical protein P389DRAFT_210211 [Cystobasidium minutum MCA 4210]|uniref:uncharacterized protein n=1 Tax=Cystobasidium minutum MCA 4210 TaxID=1397322 RepID=UPI0034CD559D|eukprot:jgi/Rhomi1/210211/estExt_Genemark1.C_3_t20439
MDDLLDLNWTSSNTSHSATLGPGSAASGSQSKPASRAQSPATYSAFDSLASASSSYAPNYSSTSYGNQSSQPSRLTPTPAVPAVRTPSPNPSINAASRQTASSRTRDAFDSLFDDAGSSAKNKDVNKSMTLQERMQMQSGKMGFSQPINASQPQKTSSDPWDFDMLSPTSSSSSKPVEQSKSPINRSSSPFDMFDDLEISNTRSQSNGSSQTTMLRKQQQTSSAGADDDILGLLGQPVASAKPSPEMVAPRPVRQRATDSPAHSTSSSRPPSRPTAARTPSPPPHILGQVVSMGFSVQQARLALAATLGSEQPGQWNINAAMEILASDGAAHAARRRAEEPASREPFDNEREEDDEAYLRRQRGERRQRQGTDSSQASVYRERERNGTHSPSQATLDATANDLLQQASVFGTSMLKSANAYWKTSKAHLQKAIDEKKLAIPIVSGPSSGRNSPSTGRPRWMTEERDVSDEQQQNGSSRPQQNGFKDDDDTEDVLRPHPSDRRPNRERERRPEDHRQPTSRTQQDIHARRGQESSLLNGDSPRSASLLGPPQTEKRQYISPNRRKVAVSAPVTSVPPHSPTPPVSAKPEPARRPRPKVSATPAQLETSRKHRTIGNEHFKLGRYGEAVEAYTKASNALPEGHMAQAAVLNNRANARLKIGEERQASADATSVLSILCAPSQLESVKREEWEVILHDLAANPVEEMQNEKFDAPDILGKALARRARGYEGCEKWRLAMLDWQMVTELGDPAVVKSAGGMRVVSEGLSRCRKVVEGPTKRAAAASAPKRAQPTRASKPPTVSTPVHSEAVDKLRESNKKAEADEAERLNVKDAVDAKITEWKGGKENNLRALIASLDNVLWEELGWKKVGMHELISESQLKVRYVRAISKVHPDKIGPNVPIERRLIANAVFSTLSDAWNAHNSK